MDVVVVIEVPRGSGNKYEADRQTGAITLDRPLSPEPRFPTDYGYVPETLGLDGDPLDAIVLLEEATFPGCRVRCRPIGLFRMEDEGGPDSKLIAVPHWDGRSELGDLPDSLLAVIRHFFEVYKDLDPDRDSRVLGWDGRPAAETELRQARERFAQGA